jgi:hypothetical protein
MARDCLAPFGTNPHWFKFVALMSDGFIPPEAHRLVARGNAQMT